MNVLFVSTYKSRGGAAHSTGQFALKFLEKGYNVDFFTSENLNLYRLRLFVHKILEKLLSKRNHAKLLLPFDNRYVSRKLEKLVVNYDIVIVNWIGDGFLSWNDLTRLGEIRLYINVLDEIYFNLGCHYSLSCENCLEGIGVCPSLRFKYISNYYLARNRQHKFELSALNNLKFIAHNDSYYKTISGEFGEDQVVKIPMPFDKALIVKEVSYPKGNLSVGFLSPQISNKRKGFGDFLNVVDWLKENAQISWHSAGNGVVDHPSINHRGYLAGREIIQFYCDIDVLIFTSSQENLSNILLNAVANGVFVLCYDVGGNSDIVCQDKYGKLYAQGDIRSVVRGLKELDKQYLRTSRELRSSEFRSLWQSKVDLNFDSTF